MRTVCALSPVHASSFIELSNQVGQAGCISVVRVLSLAGVCVKLGVCLMAVDGFLDMCGGRGCMFVILRHYLMLLGQLYY